MKKTTTFLFSMFLTISTFANVNYIDISKISSDSKFEVAFNYIKDNQQFYEHWINEWTYNKPKQEFINRLRDNYNMFFSIENKSTELFLLLGDIAHYLYNLDDTAYYSKAESNYKLAIKENPKDYRGYWFLGYHYAQSNVPNQAIDNFMIAQQLLPTDQPSDFWIDYAWATAVTNMPSHCIFAMDKVKSISGSQGSFETQLGQNIRDRIEPVGKNNSYKKEEIWTASQGEKMTFICRPLGIKILIDSTWNLSLTDYNKGQSAFIINPPALKNNKGKEINYIVAILMKTANSNENLDDYLSTFISPYPKKTKISFFNRYEKTVAYEIIDKNMYQEMGGAHLYMIGIERTAPEYPGFLLENPVTIPKGNSGQISYYSASNSKDRFKGKIFYAIMLDTCEDINEPSLTIFKTLFNNQIIIE